MIGAITRRSFAIALILAGCVAQAATLTQAELSQLQTLWIGNRPALKVPDTRLALLGQKLFTNTRISSNQRSCSSCHPRGGTAPDVEANRAPNRRRAPTLVDVGWNRWFFWDGRAISLEAAVLEPLLNQDEVGSSPALIRDTYRGNPTFSLLPNPESSTKNLDQLSDSEVLEVVGVALAEYLRTLQSQPTRLDKFAEELLSGKNESVQLSLAEVRGLRLFLGKGRCITCHNSWRLSDGEFHNLRLLDKNGGVPTDPGRLAAIEKLRQAIASPMAQKFAPKQIRETIPYLHSQGELFGAFKTPTLRGLVDNSPLMHQGQLASIRDVVLHYSEFGKSYPGHGAHDLLLQPLRLNASEIDELVAFLKTLSFLDSK